MTTSAHTYITKYSKQPWLGWLLVCLCRQQDRQNWLLGIHETLLRSKMNGNGTVPGMPNWSFDYHGRGLCLSGPNNEILDVDFYDDDVKTIDPYFFAYRIIELNPAPAPEERLRRWLPDKELLVAGIRILQGGPLTPKESHVFQLDQSLNAIWDEIAHIDFKNSKVYQLWFKELEDSSVGEENPVVIEKHSDWLESLIDNQSVPNSIVSAVTENLPPDRQLKLCLNQLKGPIDHSTAAAVGVLNKRTDAPTEQVEEILLRLKPKIHHPYIAWQICRFLLSRNLNRNKCIDVLKSFSAQRIVKGYRGNPYDYELALLCLSYAPEEGLQLFRRALRSSTPICIEESSALLAIIDEPWCHYELEAALTDGSHKKEPAAQRLIAAALLHSSNKLTQARGKLLMPESRKRKENEIGYTFDEVVEAGLKANFPLAIERVRKDIDSLNLEKIRECWSHIQTSELSLIKRLSIFVSTLWHKDNQGK